MTETEYRTLTQQVKLLSQEIQGLKEDIAKLKGEEPAHKYTKEEVDAFKKSRDEFFDSYRKFLQAIRQGMDADLIIKYKKQYLKEIEKRFTGDYIDRTKSRFLAEFEFAYNSSPKIIVVDGYTIPIDGNTMGGKELMETLKKQNNTLSDDDIRTIAQHYYERIHTDNIPAMMAMLDRALDYKGLNENLDSILNEKMPWDDDSQMTVK